jgi:hypothetical protein
LLTVSHATGDNQDWALQLRYNPGMGTQLYRLGKMNFLGQLALDSLELKLIDFSYVELPTNTVPYRQRVNELTTGVDEEVPITIHRLTFDEAPQLDDEYGFSGLIMLTQEEHFGTMYLTGELRPYDGLRFIRTEGDYHVFKLPIRHPGHDHFKGCSGAPIVNGLGTPVALVCAGSKEEDEIWGISLRAYKIAIDASIDSMTL